LPGNVSLRHVTLKGPRYEFPIKALIPGFRKENPDVDVAVDGWPYEKVQWGEELLNNASPYDVYSLASELTNTYVASKSIIPLDSYIDDEEIGIEDPDDYNPINWEIYKNKDEKGEVRTYGIPTDVNANIMYYRKDLLRQHSMQPPETWDQVVEFAKLTTDRPRMHGFLTQLTPWYSGNFYVNVLWDQGGDIFDQKTWEASANSEEGLRALNLVVSMHKNYGVEDELNFDRFMFNDYLADKGVCAIAPCMYGNGVPQNPTMSKYAEQIGTGIKPGGPGGRYSMMAGVGCVITPRCKHPREAFAWIEYQQRKELMRKFVEETGQPGRESTLTDPEIQKLPNARHFQTLSDVFKSKGARTKWNLPREYEVEQAIGEEVFASLTGKKLAQQALESIDSRVSDKVPN
jgi:ABC-type glycerol-3-phosphate transport system substrate-binding protein